MRRGETKAFGSAKRSNCRFSPQARFATQIFGTKKETKQYGSAGHAVFFPIWQMSKRSLMIGASFQNRSLVWKFTLCTPASWFQLINIDKLHLPIYHQWLHTRGISKGQEQEKYVFFCWLEKVLPIGESEYGSRIESDACARKVFITNGKKLTSCRLLLIQEWNLTPRSCIQASFCTFSWVTTVGEEQNCVSHLCTTSFFK